MGGTPQQQKPTLLHALTLLVHFVQGRSGQLEAYGGSFDLFTGHDSSGEDEEPDLFQCGKCKQMFTNLQRYLTHKQERNCHKRQHLWEAASSVNSGSSEVSEELSLSKKVFKESVKTLFLDKNKIF